MFYKNVLKFYTKIDKDYSKLENWILTNTITIRGAYYEPTIVDFVRLVAKNFFSGLNLFGKTEADLVKEFKLYLDTVDLSDIDGWAPSPW